MRNGSKASDVRNAVLSTNFLFEDLHFNISSVLQDKSQEKQPFLLFVKEVVENQSVMEEWQRLSSCFASDGIVICGKSRGNLRQITSSFASDERVICGLRAARMPSKRPSSVCFDNPLCHI